MKKLLSAVLCLLAALLLMPEYESSALFEGEETAISAAYAVSGKGSTVVSAESGGTSVSSGEAGIHAEAAARDLEEAVTLHRPAAIETDAGSLEEQGAGATGSGARLEGAESVIRAGLEEMTATVDLQEYSLTKDELKSIYSSILNSSPELFYVGNSYKLKLSAGKVVTVSPIYLYTAEELPALRAVYEQKLSEIIALLDPGMTDLEKLMFLNDYFCLEYSYDGTYAVYDTLRFFTEKTGVCQAYTLALTAVLERIGIPVTYAQSSEMNHIWNVVQLDGKWYHMDLTWNDPLDDRFGRALHENFLKSDAGIAATGHYGWTTAGGVTCTDTTYDNAFWKSVRTPFSFTDGQTFYMDDGVIYRVSLSTQEKTVLLTVPDRWTVQDKPGYSYSVSYSGLAAYDGCLFYTTPGAVMRYRLSTGQSEQYCAPALSSGQLFAFYGIGDKAHWLSASAPESEQNLLAAGSLQLTGKVGTEDSVLLTGSDAFTRFCPTIGDALSRMTDSDLSYTLTPYLAGGSFNLTGIRELPAVSSVTLKGRGTTLLVLDGSVTLRSALHLSGVRPVSAAEGGAFLLQSNMLTLIAEKPELSVRVTGDAASSLVILSTGGDIVLSAPVTVGTFAAEGTVRLGAAFSAGVFRAEGDCTVAAGADFTCGSISGTGKLTLSGEQTAEGGLPALRITGKTGGTVTVLFDPEQKLGEPILYAPKAEISGIVFRLKDNAAGVDITPLFDRGTDGWFRYAREVYMQIEDGILLSFVSAVPQKHVEIPEEVTGIGNYAFAFCPEPEKVYLPAGIKTVGAFGIGYGYDAAGKLYVSDKTVYEVAQGSACEAYAEENGLLFDSYLEGDVGDFFVRVFPVRPEARLVAYTGSETAVILPASVSFGGVTYTELSFAETLFSGKQGLVIYCPVSREDVSAAAVWEETQTVFYSGEWFLVTFCSGDEVFFAYPAPKDSEVLLPEQLPSSAALDTPEFQYFFESWDGYAEGMRVTGDLSFRAIFGRKRQIYTYVFYAEDGVTVVTQGSAEYGTVLEAPDAPDKPPLEDGTLYVFIGWSGYSSGMKLTKNMTFRATYAVSGDVPTEILSLYYRIDRAFGFVRKIDVETNGNIFVGGFYGNQYLELTTAEGETVPEGTCAGTGMKLRLVVRHEVLEELTLVVTGDLNGDGQATITDFVLLKSCLLGSRELSGAYYEAADLTGDGEVTLTDFIRLKAYLLGAADIEPQ